MKNRIPTAKNNMDIGSNTSALVFRISETKGSAATESDALCTAHEKRYTPDAQKAKSKAHLRIFLDISVRLLRTIRTQFDVLHDLERGSRSDPFLILAACFVDDAGRKAPMERSM